MKKTYRYIPSEQRRESDPIFKQLRKNSDGKWNDECQRAFGRIVSKHT